MDRNVRYMVPIIVTNTINIFQAGLTIGPGEQMLMGQEGVYFAELIQTY